MPRVGISFLQGAHQVAQRFITTTWPLKSARVWGFPAPSVNTVAGAARGWAGTSSFAKDAFLNSLRSTAPAGLNEAEAMTYRTAATPISSGGADHPLQRAELAPGFVSFRLEFAHMTDNASDKPAANGQGQAMWGGRFSAKPAELMQAINVSIGFDKRLWAQDLAGSRAHARMLISQGVIAREAGEEILKGWTPSRARSPPEPSRSATNTKTST